MRRVLLAAVAGVLLTTAACTAGAKPEAAASAPAPAPASEAPAPTTGDPVLAADTKKVCTQIMTDISKDLSGFGTEVGKMIAGNQAKSPADAKKAQAAAKAQLHRIAQKIRSQTATAHDPKLRQAGRQAADAIDKTASSNSFYAGITDVKNVDSALQNEMVVWLTPLADNCG